MNNPKQWQEAISKLGGQLVDALRPVAEKMGVAAEHLYGVLVRQSIVDSISNLAGWWIVAAFVIYGAYRIRLEVGTEKWKCEDDRVGTIAFSWMITAGAVAVIAISLSSYLPGILNPEYLAIKTLLDAVKK